MSTKLFTYTALDMQGMRQTGVVQAISENAARDELGKRGFRVEILQEGQPYDSSRDPISRNVVAPIVGKVNFETLQRFYAQLWSMYKSGVPLVTALETLADTNNHPKMRTVIRKMKEYVLHGRPMSECMAEYPEVFSSLQTNLIRVGEKGGALESSLEHLKEYISKEIKLRNKMKAATFYAKILLLAIIFIPIGANMVIGMVAKDSPFQLFTFLTLPIAIVSIAIILVFWLIVGPLLMNQRPFRLAVHQGLLFIPYIGGTVHMLAMAKFGRAFSAMYRGGLPMQQTIALAAEACGNEYIAAKIRPAAIWIQEGRPIAQSLANTKAFNRVTLDMVNTGEHTGNLDAMLENIAAQFEDEADVRAEKMVKIVPLFLLLIAAVFVAYILVNFIMNYIQNLESAGG